MSMNFIADRGLDTAFFSIIITAFLCFIMTESADTKIHEPPSKVPTSAKLILSAAGLIFLASQVYGGCQRDKANKDRKGCVDANSYVTRYPEIKCVAAVREAIEQCDRAIVNTEIPSITEQSSLSDLEARERAINFKMLLENTKAKLQEVCSEE